MAGARTFAYIRSVIATARKQGWNILQRTRGLRARLLSGKPYRRLRQTALDDPVAGS
jgi:hypothetical protein